MPNQRHEDARKRLEMTESHARNEAVAAQRMIDDFIAKASEKGITPEPLRAKLLSGQDVKTDKTGWYLRKNKSIAIGADGGYYVLTVPGGLMERVRGVKLSPTPPPLQVGRGGRDGETGDLAEFLAWRLEG